MQAVAAAFRAHPAAALWDEVDGLHPEQCEAFLWRLQLATSSRKAVKIVNQVLASLCCAQHPDTTFIRRMKKGFDWLGYHLSPAGTTFDDSLRDYDHCLTPTAPVQGD